MKMNGHCEAQGRDRLKSPVAAGTVRLFRGRRNGWTFSCLDTQAKPEVMQNPPFPTGTRTTHPPHPGTGFDSTSGAVLCSAFAVIRVWSCPTADPERSGLRCAKHDATPVFGCVMT